MAEKTNLKNLLAKYSTMKEFKSGDNLYNYGQKAEKIYFILSGLIRIYIKDNNKEIEIQRNKNGSFVGETAFTADNYSSRAEVYLNTKVLEFDVANLRKIMKNNNSFANKMINNLSQYIELLENKNKIQLPPISKIDKKIKAEKMIKKTIKAEKNVDDNKKKIINQAAVKIKNSADFYLDDHGSYNKKASENDKYYLYDKEIECPVCSHKINIKKLRNSRLRIEKIRDDLRPIYKDFNLYYYSVLSCPDCLFTARRKDFNNFSKSRKRKVRKNFKKLIKNELGKDFKVEYTDPRNINQVFDAHYLALKLYNYTDFYTDKKAFLWRELSWIYEDLDANKLSKKASLKALDNLEEFYFKEDTKSTKKESDNITLLLAVLYYKHGEQNKSLTLLDELIRDTGVNLRQKNKARDLFLKIREENRKKEN